VRDPRRDLAVNNLSDPFSTVNGLYIQVGRAGRRGRIGVRPRKVAAISVGDQTLLKVCIELLPVDSERSVGWEDGLKDFLSEYSARKVTEKFDYLVLVVLKVIEARRDILEWSDQVSTTKMYIA
jgi:hypothetical protein